MRKLAQINSTVHSRTRRMRTSAGRLLGREKECRKGTFLRDDFFLSRDDLASLIARPARLFRGSSTCVAITQCPIHVGESVVPHVCVWSDWTLLACKARCRSRCMVSRIAKIGYLAPAFYVFTHANLVLSSGCELGDVVRSTGVHLIHSGFNFDKRRQLICRPIKTRRQIYRRSTRLNSANGDNEKARARAFIELSRVHRG